MFPFDDVIMILTDGISVIHVIEVRGFYLRLQALFLPLLLIFLLTTWINVWYKKAKTTSKDVARVKQVTKFMKHLTEILEQVKGIMEQGSIC